MPGDIETSMSVTVESVPEAKHEKSLATLGLAAITKTSFYQEDTLAENGLSVQDHRKEPCHFHTSSGTKTTISGTLLQKPTNSR
jgi:hypothetical protein